jgi:hypothetical protein
MSARFVTDFEPGISTRRSTDTRPRKIAGQSAVAADAADDVVVADAVDVDSIFIVYPP